MNSVSKHVCIDKLDDIVTEYNNTFHNKIKMKPVEIKSNTCIDSSKEINNIDSKYKIGEPIKIPKYKNFFVKIYTPNWSEEVFEIKKVKNTVP